MNGSDPRKRTLFVYLGRRGALSQFALELTQAAGERAVLVISRQNELFDQIVDAGAPTVPVDTFSNPIGAILNLPRIVALRRKILEAIREHDAGSVVVLMPHVWTPLIAPAVKHAGAHYTVVIHDGVPHPGDPTALVNSWLMRDAHSANRVVTLSEHVKQQLLNIGIPADRIRVLFHPMLGRPGRTASAATRDTTGFLFFGRIMDYKGLPLFVEACEILRKEGLSFGIAVVGEGNIEPLRNRLEHCGAEIINRWVAHAEIDSIFSRYDVAVVPSTEASQSGVIATAHGHGLPAIVTPVGALPDQIDRGETGLVAASISAAAIAAEMRRYLLDPHLRKTLQHQVFARQDALSMTRFVDELLALR